MDHTIELLYTTVSSEAEAKDLAKTALRQRYAACVNIIPQAISLYEWEGKIEESSECLVIFKTSALQILLLKEWLMQNHPYTVPAILNGAINASQTFAQYIQESTSISPTGGTSPL